MLDLLRSLIEDVTAADARRYTVTDNAGCEMHCAKIIADDGRYLAVYHSTLGDGRFHVALATSPDLLGWHRERDFGPNTSQPTIANVPGGGYLVAWEQEPKNHIALRYFADREALLGGRPLRAFDAKRSLSRCAEGTPNIYAAQLNPDIDHSVITLGGHYWWKCDVDRQLSATLTEFKRWKAAREPEFDAALLRFGVGGNIGGRDPISFFGHAYAVIEAQHAKGDFGSWRTYVYDYDAREAHPLRIRTAGGSTAFANPHVTALTAPDGNRALAVSLFLPGEGAAKGEGGQLIYYRTY
ncbi:MAG TPA: hypothetical protein VFU74_07415 [Actinocrinis sp.]|nr:hypothetical protein [Actinocrinis sp.]